MIVIYSKNGTITNLKLDSYVNQGSSGVNKIFVYIDGYEPSEWTMTAVFSLPNGTTNNLLVTDEDTETYGGIEYKGRSFYLTQAQTYYAGNLGMTITLLDNNGRILVTSRFDIIINETGVTPDADETEITRQLYYSLIQALNTKQEKSVHYFPHFNTQTEAETALDDLETDQYFIVGTENNYSIYKKYVPVAGTKYAYKLIDIVDKDTLNNTIATLRKNAFKAVDTSIYTTLDDFLKSSGEEGYVYLYPIDTSDITKGFYQYIYEYNETKYEWITLGTTKLDLTPYFKSDGSEKITGDVDFNDNNINNLGNINSQKDINKFTSVDNGQTFVIESNNQGSNSQAEIRLYKTNDNGQKRLDVIFYDDTLELACQTTNGNNTEYAYIMEIAQDGTCEFTVGAQSSKVPTNNKDLTNKEYVDNKISEAIGTVLEEDF